MKTPSGLARQDCIFYASDWRFVLRSFVVEQHKTYARMPHFSGARFAAIERGSAVSLFGRFQAGG